MRHLTEILDADSIQSNLKTFTAFNNRYYQSETGNQSAEWLLEKVRSYVPLNSSIDVSIFQHVYRQSSIIATIPGKTAKTVVVGAHQDSINGEAGGNRTTARAPGAGMTFLLRCSDQPLTPSDDNGSGSMTTLEAFRTLVQQEAIVNGKAPQTIEFHWYAAEEIGLLGSGNVFRAYAEENRDIAAMLNQDMTGYTAGYTSHNMTPKFGVVTDRTDAALTNFTKLIIEGYTNTSWADTQCDYGCSDHDSATKAGYPSAFVFEGEMHGVNDNPYVHSAEDTIEKIDFGHMIEHAKLVLGFVVELAFANL